MRVKTFFGAALILASAALAHGDPCHLSSGEIQKYLRMEYRAFDQDMKGGWRSLADRGCNLEAASLLDQYRGFQPPSIPAWQRRILFWHAGQLYAVANAYPLALERFQSARDPDEKPSDSFKWNAYADATIAFLKSDLVTLVLKRDELATATNPGSKNNLRVVEHLLQCFGKPYAVAYGSGPCP